MATAVLPSGVRGNGQAREEVLPVTKIHSCLLGFPQLGRALGTASV